MPEVIFPGPDGRLEGRYHPQKDREAPIAIILHPHPQYGGSMNNKVVYNLHYTFFRLGFTCLRFNFRGVGRSQGEYDQGIGELSDAAAALDYLQLMNPNARSCWVAGFSFGAWIGMQLLMRRPEIAGFVSVAPPASMYDFSFLAPCPSSGLIINGEADRVAPPAETLKLADKLKAQRGIVITHQTVPGANHFFEPGMETMIGAVEAYVKMRLAQREVPPPLPPSEILEDFEEEDEKD
jgi:alpha/beta superfamily hydrolase